MDGLRTGLDWFMHAQSIARSRNEVVRAAGWGERLFTLLVLLLANGAFMSLLGSEEAAGKGALAIVLQVLWSLIYLVTVVLYWRSCTGLLSVVRKNKFLFLLVGLAVLSTCWSEDPAFTFRRSVALIGTTLFGVYFASRFSLIDQIKFLSRVFLVGAIASPVVALVLPHYGLADPTFGYAWQGIYTHKNVLGVSMALGVILFVFRAILARPRGLRWWAAVGLALGVLLMAHSSTGSVALAVTLLVFVLSPGLRWPPKKLMILCSLVALMTLGAMWWATTHLTTVLSWVSRDSSFTGRTTIWMVSIAMIPRHLWLGYGYNEFWPAYGSDMVARLTHLSEMSHAHNAILNVWLDVGLVGVVLFAIQYFKSLWGAIKAVRHSNTIEWFWPLIFLFFLGVYGLVESVVLQRNGLSWMVFTAVVVQVSFHSKTRLSPVLLSKRQAAA